MNAHREHRRRTALVASIVLGLAASCASTAAQESASENADLNAAKRRASVQLGAGDYAGAASTLEALLKSVPKDDQVYTMLGDAYRGLGDFANAVKSYEQAIRLDYGDHLPHLKLGTLLMENGKSGRALTEFELAIKFGATDPLVHYNYGLALNDVGRKKEALAQWKVARDMEPNNARFVAAVGIGLMGVDDEAAVNSFARAEELGLKDDAAFCNNYALALESVGSNEEAEKHFQCAIAIGGAKEDEYRRNLARHYLRVGKDQDAAREFETLVARDGGLWSDTVYLARALVATSRFDEAIDRLEPFAADVESGKIARTDPRIDRMPPTLGEALAVLGMAWRGRGDLARARDYLRRAVLLDPADASQLNNYGVVLAESGMLPDAKAQWRRVLEIDPDNATAKANLSAFGQ
jgi:tetratricopeptide (TPR) repeat protein